MNPPERKKAFEPGQMVKTFTGQIGLVIGSDELPAVRDRFKEGRRPGHYFAPGCCPNPDYATQVPVLFDDGTYDVMRGMTITTAEGHFESKRKAIRAMMNAPLNS